MQWNQLPSEKQTLPVFQFRQHGGRLGIADLFPIFIAFLTHGKPPVVDEPAASQCPVDEVFLFSVRVDPEFDSFLHYPILSFCLCDVFWFSIYCFTVSSGAPPTVDTK